MTSPGLHTALAGCAYLVVYVLPLYVVRGPRDSPPVIKARLAATAITSALLTWVPIILAFSQSNGRLPRASEAAALLGLTAHGFWSSVAQGLGLTALLFAGPLAYRALGAVPAHGPPRHVSRRSALQVLRDLCLAPLSEELVFRASLLAFLRQRGLGAAAAVAASLALFAAAHVHHLVDRVWHGGHSVRVALRAAALQAAYTAAFGLHAAALWTAGRSVAGPVAAHLACNLAGLPPLGAMLRHRQAPLLLLLTVMGVAGWARSIAWLFRRHAW
ncbi:hypothetical protein ACKKBG_A03420 [Auxenochlorella protothecoides x Auxenochlorella symbiontica]